MACLDGHMNIAMEQTEEYINGQLKSKYGDTFIRGNNGIDYCVFVCDCFFFFFETIIIPGFFFFWNIVLYISTQTAKKK